MSIASIGMRKNTMQLSSYRGKFGISGSNIAHIAESAELLPESRKKKLYTQKLYTYININELFIFLRIYTNQEDTRYS